ncbi:MAG: hypothetical protein H6842_14925 [Rhodospirillaceae bacterium]|nr:hypothetical protein [Rhodospirillaceae bacterium]
MIPETIVDRPLTDGERHMSTLVFKNEVDTKLVRIRYPADPLNEERRAYTDGNIIKYPYNIQNGAETQYSDDLSKSSHLDKRRTLIHELAHVWQYQPYGRKIGHSNEHNEYSYRDRLNDRKWIRFDLWGREQQAEAYGDLYLLIIGRESNAHFMIDGVLRRLGPEDIDLLLAAIHSADPR